VIDWLIDQLIDVCCVADSNVSLLRLFLHAVGATSVCREMSRSVMSSADRCLWWTQLLPLMTSAALRLVYPSQSVKWPWPLLSLTHLFLWVTELQRLCDEMWYFYRTMLC